MVICFFYPPRLQGEDSPEWAQHWMRMGLPKLRAAAKKAAVPAVIELDLGVSGPARTFGRGRRAAFSLSPGFGKFNG